jgi:hypothetical protein
MQEHTGGHSFWGDHNAVLRAERSAVEAARSIPKRSTFDAAFGEPVSKAVGKRSHSLRLQETLLIPILNAQHFSGLLADQSRISVIIPGQHLFLKVEEARLYIAPAIPSRIVMEPFYGSIHQPMNCCDATAGSHKATAGLNEFNSCFRLGCPYRLPKGHLRDTHFIPDSIAAMIVLGLFSLATRLSALLSRATVGLVDMRTMIPRTIDDQLTGSTSSGRLLRILSSFWFI